MKNKHPKNKPVKINERFDSDDYGFYAKAAKEAISITSLAYHFSVDQDDLQTWVSKIFPFVNCFVKNPVDLESGFLDLTVPEDIFKLVIPPVETVIFGVVMEVREWWLRTNKSGKHIHEFKIQFTKKADLFKDVTPDSFSWVKQVMQRLKTKFTPAGFDTLPWYHEQLRAYLEYIPKMNSQKLRVCIPYFLTLDTHLAMVDTLFALRDQPSGLMVVKE